MAANSLGTLVLLLCTFGTVSAFVFTKSDQFLTPFVSLAICATLLFAHNLRQQSFKNDASSLFINSRLPVVKWTRFRLPFLDGLITVANLRRDGVEFIANLQKTYGNTFKIPVGMKSVVVISELDHVQAVLSATEGEYLSKPSYYYGTLLTRILRDGLVGAPYPKWHPHRRAVASAFTYKAFVPYLKFINDGALRLIDQVVPFADGNGVISNIDMKREIDHTAVTIISEIILGSESLNLTAAEREEFHTAFNIGKDASLDRFLHPEQMIPVVWALHPNKRKMDLACEKVELHITKLIHNYIARDIIRGNLKRDINDFSLTAVTDSTCFESDSDESAGDLKQVETEKSTGVKPYECLLEKLIKASISNKEITDEITTFMVAGHETITTALDMLIFHLALNPEIQAKCHDEIDEFFDAPSNTERENVSFSLEDLNQLKYLERCILESMRLAPTIPIILRWLDKPLRINNDLYFEGNQTMCIYIWGIHRNPAIYPNPERFDPDRFLPEFSKGRHYYSFLPFSLGPRNCIGWKLAMMEMKVLMARILRNFNFTTSDRLNDVKLNFHITLKPDRAHKVFFKLRRRIGKYN